MSQTDKFKGSGNTKRVRSGNAAGLPGGEEQRENRRRSRGNTEAADWNDADAQRLKDAVVAVASAGCAIRFGYTRDRGAFAIGVVGDGDPYTEYVRPSENIDLYLVGLFEDYKKV